MAHRKLQDTDFRMWHVRGTDYESEFEHEGNDPTASPTTPLQLGSPIANKRLGMYPRSQSMNGRIQKSNFVRSQSFGSGAKGAKATYRSHHSDTLQAQLLTYMKATGMDQQKVVLVLEKLKEMYAASRDQQLQQQSPDHGSQVKWSPPRTSVRMDDPPVEASTITLLQQKFAQLEKYKESVQGQHIQLYPSNQTPQQQQAAPSPTTPSGFYYPFDETSAAAAAAAAQQQQVFLSFSRSSSAKSIGTTDDSWENSDGYPTQQQPPNNQAMSAGPKDIPPCPSYASDTGSSLGSSNNCKNAAVAADNIHALLHYMLQQQQPQSPTPVITNCNSIHQQNLTAFKKMDLSAGSNMPAGTNEPISEDRTAPALGLGLGGAGVKETLLNNNTNSNSSSNFLFSTSPLHRAATISTAAKHAQLSVDWGDGLSLLTRTPTLSPASSGGWESEASDAWRSTTSSDSIDERDIYTEPIDTSLHL